jgi:AraC family transcriptional regulator, transcriptional activator of pobA
MHPEEQRVLQLQTAVRRPIQFGDLCVNFSCVSININPPGTNVPVHCHEFYEFLLLLEGRQYVSVLGNEHLYEEGYFTLMPPGVLHGHRDYPDMGNRGIVVRFNARQAPCADQVEPVAEKLLGILSTPHAAPLSDEGITRLLTTPAESSGGTSLDLVALLIRTAEAYARDDNVLRKAPKPRVLSDRELVENVLMSISTMYMSDIDVMTLSRIHNISYRHLARLFVKITGYTLTEWMIYTRLHFSMQMLVETDLSISDVARQVGFSSESYFSSVFSRTIGQSPKAYRREKAGRPYMPPSIEQLHGAERKPECSNLYNPLRPHLIDSSRLQMMARRGNW